MTTWRAFGKPFAGRRSDLAKEAAFIARYGHQGVDEILSWPDGFRAAFRKALLDLIELEKGTEEA